MHHVTASMTLEKMQQYSKNAHTNSRGRFNSIHIKHTVKSLLHNVQLFILLRTQASVGIRNTNCKLLSTLDDLLALSA